ncbi:MAG TPA: serine hydrolase domain-containing protein [Candidatus Acidoferrum sp.]|nr:serine hydrolase domain-containing protein [Candidatus Acidoferrum sp.]
MKRFAVWILLQIACVGLHSAPGLCQVPTVDDTASRLSAYLKPFEETGNFSGTVLVARSGRVLFRKSYGMASYEWHVPNSDGTRYHIASVSKPFTALAILQLQEQGRLSVSDPVSRFVPDFPNGERITLDHLLTHTSGIPDINELPDYDTFARSPHTVEQLVAKFSGLALEFQPGTDQRYSNSNYNLLALVLEKTTGESYEEYIRKHVLEPAGMRDSGTDGEASRVVVSLASGYVPAGVAEYERAAYVDWSNKTGNGSLYSTAEDLYRFDRALATETLLKGATRQRYFAEGTGNRYGWYTRKRLGHRLMAGKGHSPGFTAELDRYLDDDVTIILLSNSYGTASQDPIAEGLAAIVFGQQTPPLPPVHAVTIAPSVMASYAGQYQFGPDYFTPNAKITLTAKPGYLLMQDGDYHTPLVPVSQTEWLERIYFGRVAIAKDAEGNVSGLAIRYGDKTYTAGRLAAR